MTDLGVQPRLVFRLPLDPARLLRARHRISDYLDEHGVPRATARDIVLVVEEAMTNAVRHSGSDGTLEVRLGFSGRDLEAEVKDHGVGFDVSSFDAETVPDPLQSGGRGLYLIARLMDDVDFSANGGLTVHMRKRGVLGRGPHQLPQSAIPDGAGLGDPASYREDRDRLLVEEIPEGFAALDWEYRFTYANELSLRLYHLERDEVVGTSIWRLFPTFRGSAVDEALRDAMELGVPSTLEYDSPTIGRAVEFRIYPTSSGVSFYIRDIEERKRGERERDEYLRALRENETRYRTLYDSLDEGFFVIDVLFDDQDRPVDLYYVESNAAARRMLGEDWAGRRLSEIDAGFAPDWFEIFGEVALTGRSVRTERYAEPHDRWYDFSAFRIGGPGSRRVGNTFKDVSERKRMEARLEAALHSREEELKATRLLARTAETAVATLSVEEVAERVLAAIQDDLPELRAGSVYILEGERWVLRQLALFGFRAEAVESIRELPLSVESNVGTVALTGRMLTHESGPEPLKSVRRALRPELDQTRWVDLPIEHSGETVGVLALFFDGKRPFTDDELRLIQAVAAILGNALRNARLYESEVAARRQVRRELETTRLLLRAADALAVWTDLDDLMRALAETVVQTTPHTRVTISLWDAGRHVLRVAASVGAGAVVPLDVPEEQLSRVLREVVRGGRLRLVDYDALPPEERGSSGVYDAHLGLMVPLRYRDRLMGVIGIDDPGERREFSHREIDLVEGIAAQAAVAIENARLYEAQRHVAVTLQEHFVHELPVVHELDLASLSVPAYAPELIGGDFHDVFVLPGGLVAAVIGDVMGKGIEAAGLTETVRSSLRALAFTLPSPQHILWQTNRLLLNEGDEQFVSALVVLLDPASGRGSVTSAGHPPPILIGGEGARAVELEHGPLLGTFAGEFTPAPLALGAGEGLLLYTDGATEARREGELFGEGRLLQVLDHARHLDSAALVEHVRRAVVEWAGDLKDDLHLLALRRRDGAADE